MRTRGAVIQRAPGKVEVVDLELDDPRPGEIQVEVHAAGLCHSDDHIATGDLPVAVYPFATGHEGAGVVVAAPPNHQGIREGDHVVFSFVPACGRCHWCATGRSNFCDLGAGALSGARFGTTDDFRLALASDGRPVGQMSGTSSLCATTTLSVDSAVRVEDDIPFTSACLLGCAVGTGWGSAVNDAGVVPGDAVIVMGVGGVGVNAVQGAAHAGATTLVAVDPVAFKREQALRFGATHAVETMAEAGEVVRDATNGQGADAVVVTVGVTRPEHVGEALSAVRKGGTCVVTGVGVMTHVGADIPLGRLTLFGQRLQGTLYGSCNPHADIPRFVRLYRQGVLRLDELVTTTYALDDVARAYEDMHLGRNLRGVVVHEH